MKNIVICFLIAICVQCALSDKILMKSRPARYRPDTKAVSITQIKETITDTPENEQTIRYPSETEEEPTSTPPLKQKSAPRTANGKKSKRRTALKKNNILSTSVTKKNSTQDSTPRTPNSVKTPLQDSVIEGDGKTGVITYNGKIVVNKDEALMRGVIGIHINEDGIFINNRLIAKELPLKTGAYYMSTFIIPPIGTIDHTKFRIQLNNDGKIRYTDSTGNAENLEIEYKISPDNTEKVADVKDTSTAPKIAQDNNIKPLSLSEENNSLPSQQSTQKDQKVISIIEGEDGNIKLDGKVVIYDEQRFKYDHEVQIRIFKKSLYLNDNLITNKLPVSSADANSPFHRFIIPHGDVTKFEIQIRTDNLIRYIDNNDEMINFKINTISASEEEDDQSMKSPVIDNNTTTSPQSSTNTDPKVQSIVEGENGDIKVDGKLVVLNEEEFKYDNVVRIRIFKNKLYINDKQITSNLPSSAETMKSPFNKFVNPPGGITKFKIQIRTDNQLRYTDNNDKSINIKI